MPLLFSNWNANKNLIGSMLSLYHWIFVVYRYNHYVFPGTSATKEMTFDAQYRMYVRLFKKRQHAAEEGDTFAPAYSSRQAPAGGSTGCSYIGPSFMGTRWPAFRVPQASQAWCLGQGSWVPWRNILLPVARAAPAREVLKGDVECCIPGSGCKAWEDVPG